MNSKFDELTRSLAQSGTRRGALKKFGVGLAGMTLACFGLAPKASGGDCKKLGSPIAITSSAAVVSATASSVQEGDTAPHRSK
jgi:hypothetical protein